VHDAAFHFGLLFDHGVFARIFSYFIKQFPSHMGEGDFSSSKDNGYFYFIFLFNKFLYMADFDFQIMGVGLGTDFYFFYLESRLLFFGFLRLLCLLVFEPAKVHYFAYRRIGIGRNFNKIQPECFGCGKRRLNRYDPKLISFRINDAHLTDFNFLVDSGLAAALS